MSNGPAAGKLPEEEDLKACITFRKGDRLANPRSGESSTFVFKVSDGYLVLRARVETLGGRLPNNFKIFFKRSKSATQAQLVELTADNFVDQLKARWARISTVVIANWQDSNTTAAQGMTFEFFIYIPKHHTTRAPRVRSPTAAAILRETRRLDEHAAKNNLRLGPIQRRHLAVHNATHPQGGAPVMLNDATTRQAAEIDRIGARIAREDAARAAVQQRNDNILLRPVRMEFNGTMVVVPVDIASLRTALGLPQHDMVPPGTYKYDS